MLSRRSVLSGLVAAAGLGALPAFARQSDVDYMVQQLLKGAPTQEGHIVLDLPQHSDSGTAVPLIIGFDTEPGQSPWPEQVNVYGSENPRPKILAASFHPLCGRPQLETKVRLNGAQVVTAIAHYNDGTYWRVDRKVGVTFGACAQVGSGPGPGPDFVPTTRISVPAAAKSGDIVPIRALISHPMETGLRLNDRTQYVPLRIIERFTCRFNDEDVLSVRLEPAISTNPYFSFFLNPRTSGTVAFEWLDTTGATYTASSEIAVA